MTEGQYWDNPRLVPKKAMDFFVSPLGQNVRVTTVCVGLRQVGAAECHKENGRRGWF